MDRRVGRLIDKQLNVARATCLSRGGDRSIHSLGVDIRPVGNEHLICDCRALESGEQALVSEHNGKGLGWGKDILTIAGRPEVLQRGDNTDNLDLLACHREGVAQGKLECGRRRGLEQYSTRIRGIQVAPLVDVEHVHRRLLSDGYSHNASQKRVVGDLERHVDLTPFYCCIDPGDGRDLVCQPTVRAGDSHIGHHQAFVAAVQRGAQIQVGVE